MTPFLETAHPKNFRRVNRFVVGNDDTVYFTGRDQSGLPDRLIDTAPCPNGIVVSADGSHLLVAHASFDTVRHFSVRAGPVGRIAYCTARSGTSLVFTPSGHDIGVTESGTGTMPHAITATASLLPYSHAEA